jgi:GAF domain-containing protein
MAVKTNAKREALQEIGALILTGRSGEAVLKQIAEMVRSACDYEWVGIYKICRSEFKIVASTGKTPPAYPRFPVTQGLSAAVVESRRTILVPDVREDSRYLPTFWTTRSEIVVPIIDDERDRVLGTLDVESAKANAFDKSDREFLEGVAGLIWRGLH